MRFHQRMTVACVPVIAAVAVAALLLTGGCTKPVAIQPAPEERAVAIARGTTVTKPAPADRIQKEGGVAPTRRAAERAAAPRSVSLIPDFASLHNSARRKQAFFDWLQPIIERENRRIMEQRKQLLRMRDRELDRHDRRVLRRLAREYGLAGRKYSERHLIERLLVRVDRIPPELVAAQAAIESAWGTSRFAREGNNLFGEWCHHKGCGMVPRRRNANAHHEVRRFASPAQSVRAYMHNINTRKEYRLLRRLRAKERQLLQPLSGYELALGLRSYSERGMAYVRQVRHLIATHRTLFAGLQHRAD